MRPFRLLLAAAIVAAIVPVGLSSSPAAAATKKTTKTTKPAKKAGPVTGGACTPLGAHAAGTSLDCVKVGAKLQWQPKGSKPNPFKIGETFEWTQSSNLREPGALISTRRITVLGYIPDASGFVSSFPDNFPDDIFNAAAGVAVKGVKMTVTLVNATDESSRNLGSLSEFWLGTDADAGCCEQGSLQWGNRPDGAVDAYTFLQDGTSTTGVMVFARTDEQVKAEPLMRLAWNDVNTNQQAYVWFALK